MQRQNPFMRKIRAPNVAARKGNQPPTFSPSGIRGATIEIVPISCRRPW